MRDGSQCPRCGDDVGFWPVLLRSPINVVCPHCNARSYYDGAVMVFVPVILVTMGLVFALYKNWIGFAIFLGVISLMNFVMVMYLRTRSVLTRNLRDPG